MTMRPVSQLAKNITMLGPPGSGKGFYTSRLVKLFDNTQVFMASGILRESHHSELDLDSGKLVDCQVVSECILSYLQEKLAYEDVDDSGDKPTAKDRYILDGFPRTLTQIDLMKKWPKEYQVHAAVQLDIPRSICMQKMLGRRRCRLCNKEYNATHVNEDGFDLPPQLPREGDCQYACDQKVDWLVRKDDTIEIWNKRMDDHERHEAPMIEHFKQSNRLLRVTPYKGIKDIPELHKTIEMWLHSL